jgi:hypothetical protein
LGLSPLKNAKWEFGEKIPLKRDASKTSRNEQIESKVDSFELSENKNCETEKEQRNWGPKNGFSFCVRAILCMTRQKFKIFAISESWQFSNENIYCLVWYEKSFVHQLRMRHEILERGIFTPKAATHFADIEPEKSKILGKDSQATNK